MITYNSDAGQLVCVLPPRMDTVVCAECQEELLARVTAAAGPVVFDMAGVEYVASAFIRICLQAAKHAGAERFKLIHVSPNVHRVFKMAGLDQHLQAQAG